MINVNAVLTINGKKIVPVRAIPFVTGNDMSPECLAGILADTDSWLLACVLGPNNTTAQMLPKNWKQYRDQLTVITVGAHGLDLSNRSTLAILPASTFVYWEALWHTHENCFLPDRREIELLPPEEQVNYELQPMANIPKALVDLVFEGFQTLVDFQNEPGDKPQDDNRLDFALLATRAELLTAYAAWGLKKQWFGELNSHLWLKDARRQVGQGQRGHVVEPLFCPYLVMHGLVNNIRGRSRLTDVKGWAILERYFPNVYQVKSVGDPREQTG